MGILFFLWVLFSLGPRSFSGSPPIATGEVTLSAEAEPIPGGYVVPEGSNVTFTCNSTSGGELLLTVNLTTPVNIRFSTNTFGLKQFPGFSSPDESGDANPASFTIHNISLENNPSPVECEGRSSHDVSRATIIVEGSPNCPILHTTVNATSLAVSIQKSPMKRLPKWYSVVVTSYNESIATIVYNSTLKGLTSFNIDSLQPGTVYNISVIPCNMAGCNELCDIHSVQAESITPGTKGPNSDDTSHVNSMQLIIIIGVAIVGTFVILLLVIIAAASAGCLIKWKKGKHTKTGGGEGHYEDIAAVNSPYDDLVAMSTSLHGPNSSSMNRVYVHQAPSQLHSPSVTSATAALYMNEGVSSNDVIMEVNPAYQSVEVAEAESATMESTQSDYI